MPTFQKSLQGHKPHPPKLTTPTSEGDPLKPGKRIRYTEEIIQYSQDLFGFKASQFGGIIFYACPSMKMLIRLAVNAMIINISMKKDVGLLWHKKEHKKEGGVELILSQKQTNYSLITDK